MNRFCAALGVTASLAVARVLSFCFQMSRKVPAMPEFVMPAGIIAEEGCPGLPLPRIDSSHDGGVKNFVYHHRLDAWIEGECDMADRMEFNVPGAFKV